MQMLAVGIDSSIGALSSKFMAKQPMLGYITRGFDQIEVHKSSKHDATLSAVHYYQGREEATTFSDNK